MDMACSTRGIRQIGTKFQEETLKGNGADGKLGIDGVTVLK
jgi:hypothetical protein